MLIALFEECVHLNHARATDASLQDSTNALKCTAANEAQIASVFSDFAFLKSNLHHCAQVLIANKTNDCLGHTGSISHMRSTQASQATNNAC